MKVASSMAELEEMIMDEIYSAMSTAKSKAEQDTKTEVQSFYSPGSPTIYVRHISYGYTYSITEHKIPRLRHVLGGKLHQFYTIGMEQPPIARQGKRKESSVSVRDGTCSTHY